MQAEAPGFERDIRPLFRSKDIESMSGAFDLSSYEYVRNKPNGSTSASPVATCRAMARGHLSRSSASADGLTAAPAADRRQHEQTPSSPAADPCAPGARLRAGGLS
jgi:hypothetical protein